MNDKDAQTKTGRKAGKYVLYGVTFLTLGILAVNWVWKFSGSNEWELYGDRDGIKMYSLKTPGSDLKKYRGVGRVKASINTIVNWMQDPDSCIDSGCYDSRLIERVDDKLLYYTFKYDFPLWIQTRELVVMQLWHQDPATNTVLLELIADPGKTAPDSCCFRVRQMYNSFLLTPLENGEIEVEFVMDMDQGGFIPDALINFGLSQGPYLALFTLQGELDEYEQKHSTDMRQTSFAEGVAAN